MVCVTGIIIKQMFHFNTPRFSVMVRSVVGVRVWCRRSINTQTTQTDTLFGKMSKSEVRSESYLCFSSFSRLRLRSMRKETLRHGGPNQLDSVSGGRNLRDNMTKMTHWGHVGTFGEVGAGAKANLRSIQMLTLRYKHTLWFSFSFIVFFPLHGPVCRISEDLNSRYWTTVKVQQAKGQCYVTKLEKQIHQTCLAQVTRCLCSQWQGHVDKRLTVRKPHDLNSFFKKNI